MVERMLYMKPPSYPVITTPPLKFSGAIVPRISNKTLFMSSIFKVIGCNPSNEGKTFVWKLEVIVSDVLVFGIKKTVKRTYYIGGMPSEVKVNTEIKEDLAKFEIVERPYSYVEDNETVTINLKWLHVKVA